MIPSEERTNYLFPFISLVILFFFVGFLTTANGQFQGPLKATFLSEAGSLKNTFATLISFSWFMAYPLLGGVASSSVNRRGYKKTLIRGLILLIIGLGVFWLSSVYTIRFPESTITLSSAVVPIGFFIFLLGSFVVGAAATLLQVVINPYLAACNVKGTQAIQRMSIGGASNSLGTTVAPFFVAGIVFGGLSMEEVQVDQLQIPFIGLMVVFAVIIVVFLRVPLPDIQGTRAEGNQKLEKNIWSFRHLTLGVIAIFFYMGVEVCVGANINLYASELLEGGRTPALMATLYWTGMLIGRLVSSSLNKIAANVQLAFAASSAIVLVILAMIINNPWLLVAVGLFHSVMWGGIFALSISNLGKYTSKASGVFMIGVIGGALLPLFQGVVADMLGGAWRWTWMIVLVGELYILYYGLVGYISNSKKDEDSEHVEGGKENRLC